MDDPATIPITLFLVVAGLFVEYMIIRTAVLHGLLRFLDAMGGIGSRGQVRGARSAVAKVADVVLERARADAAQRPAENGYPRSSGPHPDHLNA